MTGTDDRAPGGSLRARKYPVPGLKRTHLAGILFVVVAVGMVANVPLTLLSHQEFNGLVPVVIGVPGAVTGALAARRQPANPVGWLLLALSACLIIANDGSDYAALVYLQGYRLPAGAVGLSLGQLWGPGIELLGLIVLLFPDGKLTSAWLRRALWLYLVVLAISVGALVTATAEALAATPVAVDQTGGFAATDSPKDWYGPVSHGTDLVLTALIVLAVVRQILSWRSSSGERRQQLKWLAVGGIAVPVSLILAGVGMGVGVGILGAVGWLGLALFPLCIGVAILKYRLYDVDRIVSRTLSYAIVTGLLVGVYVGLVALTTKVLGFTSPVGVAASTLAAVVLFNPLRRRVQHLVDRRFNRARYHAERTVGAFAARLQDAVDAEAVRADLLAAVSQSVEPAHLSVWLCSES